MKGSLRNCSLLIDTFFGQRAITKQLIIMSCAQNVKAEIPPGKMVWCLILLCTVMHPEKCERFIFATIIIKRLCYQNENAAGTKYKTVYVNFYTYNLTTVCMQFSNFLAILMLSSSSKDNT